MTLYPAHSDAQVADAANAYQHSDFLATLLILRTIVKSEKADDHNPLETLSPTSTET